MLYYQCAKLKSCVILFSGATLVSKRQLGNEFRRVPCPGVSMQTLVMPNSSTATPWLEVDFNGGNPEKVALGKFPFIMGRGETADLRVPSTRVSREHAVIAQQGRTYTLRDLGSTNGTFVNGKRLAEATLSDGDVILLADEQLTFFSGEGVSRDVTTQVMGGRPAAESEGTQTQLLIAAVRRLQEAVVHRSGQIRFQPIVSLLDDSVLGWDGAVTSESCGAAPASLRQVLETAHCRATTRWRRALRRWAVEEAEQFSHHGLLFLPADPAEVDDDDTLIAELEQLRSLARNQQKLVVQLPEAAVSELPGLPAFRSHLHDLDIRLCFDDFAAGKAHVLQLKKAPPDFVKLAPSAVRGGEGSQNRERQVASIVRAFRELNCQVIATGVDTPQAADACRQWECPFAQGKLFGEPRPLDAVVARERNAQVARRTATPVGAAALST
jgi:EAL domain-containing protein (putative c-di-GMP-specific phosphodiesterase class I)